MHDASLHPAQRLGVRPVAAASLLLLLTACGGSAIPAAAPSLPSPSGPATVQRSTSAQSIAHPSLSEPVEPPTILSAHPSTLTFSALNTAQTVQGVEQELNGQFEADASSLNPAVCRVSPSRAYSQPVNNGTQEAATFTVTALAWGSCTVTLKDPTSLHVAKVYVTVAPPSTPPPSPVPVPIPTPTRQPN
jgi:hypothetical protein